MNGPRNPQTLSPRLPYNPTLQVQDLYMDLDASYSCVGNQGSTMFIQTNKGAPRKRVLSRDLSTGEECEVVGERAATLQRASLVGGRLILRYLRDAYSQVEVRSSGCGGGIELRV